MGIVIPFPTRQVMDDELAIQLWELVMSGQIGTPEVAAWTRTHQPPQDAWPNRRREASGGRPWR